ncbi:MAG: tRNA pseudouridine(38-40) synthase TruA [bacterium (Candidatus Ratteibacteria) CG_4_10_14_3_um_filter_41_18]|uniref:tRNA pseudouridine synthase A n=4 Tax=Candidatus Ratteibacteria TaxID=2979319 RepID=A0A2M7YHZ7_9BACT|nr:MAG: tRNA pseudouridine(38-40) synthase TruA [Candidatus Omnitrophica bacterium CG1_02_41_171]PIW34236.1 MAG: tRNA pseudouridine(38-40) synthase TruA [bacterium (Candidatus Ratteibacteria) CG15_BIG_FIL_POST_REV_8_21_14_020_41_12]PIW74410.1 MAG: tRNA pseudouridine(38-40) synthase TruA [bacterium (Candidatus Ratteibacteria) CG_4_8_14_3_um_filter_41_36]PIX77608.1 MAG: tRNA pseudouridine(38-40) synthase TruA [bacterium (Candidatus Ratteibacteria) CG_4_10_14_3_um_filter_41_18]PJA62586.1 MAG: tRNA
MRNVCLSISYDGTGYSGWQRQRNSSKIRPHLPPPPLRGRIKEGGTIQGTIEEALEKLLQEKINLIGSGRTDAGVHAIAQTANFKTNTILPLQAIKKGLNAILPGDIRINSIRKVPENFNSRYSACGKTYQYLISFYFYPFLRNYTCYSPCQLNLSAMKKASEFLVGRHNFSSFQAAGSRIRNPIRSIKRLSIKKTKTLFGNLALIEIEADGFLYKMVRNIVGTLLEVGKSKMAPDEIEKILDKKNRKFAGPTAPAKGLYLKRVKY